MKIYSKENVTYLEMILANNFHVHLREIDQLPFLVQYSAMQFGHILAMPNLKIPLTRTEMCLLYGKAILQGGGMQQVKTLKPHVALYLTDNTTAEEIRLAKRQGALAAKLYLGGATTNSDSGVTDVRKLWPIFAVMEEEDLPLSVHGEMTDSNVNLFDRERVFVDMVLSLIHDAFPNLRIILEHISTKEGVQFVQDASTRVAATVTPQHLLFNFNDVYMYPSRCCYPAINSIQDQKAVVGAVISGSKKFFLGTDSASHGDGAKYCEGGNCGCFVEPYAIPLYIKAFKKTGALNDRFEAFASFNGSDFYGLPRNTSVLRLVKKPAVIPKKIKINHGVLCTPFMAGEIVDWQVDEILS